MKANDRFFTTDVHVLASKKYMENAHKYLNEDLALLAAGCLRQAQKELADAFHCLSEEVMRKKDT